MLYSQYSHRVASKVIANNCMILKNPTKVCSEKCPFTRGEKNICDWISCSWLCFIFQLIESEFNWWTTKNTILKENIDSWLPKTHDGVLHAQKFGCFFVCLFIWRNQRKSEAQMSTSFSTKKLQKKPCELLVFTKSEVVTSALIWWDVSYDEDAWALVSEESTGSLIRRERGGTPCQ